MSKIEWTNQTWNPIIGCSKISEGCKNCYAEKMANRLACIDKTSENYSRVVTMAKNSTWSGQTHFVESALEKPLKWKKPRMIFICSMGDLFHESVPFEWIDKVIDIIKQCPQHTFQILTKRPDRMLEYFHKNYQLIPHLIKNIWLGVTAENQEQANKRIPILLQIPAKVHFVSIEPMLSIVNLNELYAFENKTVTLNSLTGIPYDWDYCKEIPENKIEKLDWVICGGESGHNARPIKYDWVRLLKDQCIVNNVPFFFKQWNKKNEGSLLDGKEYKQFPNLRLKP